MKKNNPQLSLVMPALNESKIILSNIYELKDWMAVNFPQISFEIVVVNDGSTDNMGQILDKECNKLSDLRVFHHVNNMGRGRAVRTAMENTESDYLIVLDADLSYGPEHIGPLLKPLMEGRASLTLASAYHQDGHVENVPLIRAKLSSWGNKILSSSFSNNIKTATCIVRGYTRELINHLELINNGKDFHLEVLYKTEVLGFSISEIPANLRWRNRNRGKRENGNIFRNNPLYKMRASIVSHFLINFFLKPQILFAGPIVILMLFILYGLGTLFYSLVIFYISQDPTPLRSTLLGGQLTLVITISSCILLIAFIFFFFLATQVKKYFEELYIQAARTNYRLKNLEKNILKKVPRD